MTDYTFSKVAVYAELGGALRLARNSRAFATDPVTAAPINITQGGFTAPYLDTDSSGIADFTAETPGPIRLTTGAVFVDVFSEELPGLALAAPAAAQASADAAAASAASAALSESLVGAPADTAVAAIVDNPASATRVSLSSTYGRVGPQGLVLDVTTSTYGAVADSSGIQGNGTDNAAAFAAALTAAAAYGAKVYLPPGKYRSSAQLTIGQRGALVGAGNGQPTVDANAASIIVFDSGVSGVKMTGSGSLIQEVMLLGGGGAGIGLDVQNSWVRVKDVTLKKFGSHGYNLDSSTGGIFDHAQVNGLHCYQNGGNGVNIKGGSDSNVGTYLGVNAVINAGYGLWVEAAARNSFINAHLSTNTAGGVHDDGNSNSYDVYLESGTGCTLDLGASSGYGVWYGRNFGNVGLTITGSLSKVYAGGWEFHENGTHRTVQFSDVAGVAAVKWIMRSGFDAGGTFDWGTDVGGRLLTVPYSLAFADWGAPVRVPRYTTALRPTPASAGVGATIYDTTLSKPIFSDGATWRDAAGTAV